MSRFVELEVCTVGFDEYIPESKHWVNGSVNLDEVIAVEGFPKNGDCKNCCRVLLSSGGVVYVRKSHDEFFKLRETAMQDVGGLFPGWTDGCGKPFVGDVQEVTVGDAVDKKPQFTEQQCDDIRRILTSIDKLKIARDAITTGDVVVNAMDVKNATSLDTVSCHFSPPFKGQLRASLIDCLNAELNRLRESLPFEIQTKDDSNLDADET